MRQIYFALRCIFYCIAITIFCNPYCLASFSFSLNNEFSASDSIEGIFFTPYGDLLISYGENNEIEVWDLKKEKPVRKFVSKSYPILSAAIQQDQSILAAGSQDGMLYLWEYETGKLKHTIKASPKAIAVLAFSPNGKMLASSGKDKIIRLWNVKMGRKIWELKGHGGSVHSLAFSDNGHVLISAGTDSQIKLWDVINRKEKRTITETASKYGHFNIAAFTPSLNLIAVGITEVKRASGSRRARAGRPVWNHLVKLRDGITGEELGSLAGHKQTVTALAMTADGGLVASGGPDQTIRFWNVDRKTQVSIIPLATEIKAISFSNSGQWVAAAGDNDKIMVWEIEAPTLVATPSPIQKRAKASNPVAHPASIADHGDTYAVIIGISRYRHSGISTLHYTDEDARGFYDFLVSPQGGRVPENNIKLLIDKDATLVNIRTALGVFLSKHAKRNDTVFIYYAGHGAPETDFSGTSDDGTNKYIIPYDADPDILYATGFPMTEVKTIFNRIEAERLVFFIDSCYSGAAGGRTFLSQKLKTRGLRISRKFLDNSVSQGSGRIIITASRPNEKSLELDSIRHGIFTHYLLEGLRGKADSNQDSVVHLREVFDYIEANVSNTARKIGGNQHPVMVGSFSGKIILSQPKKP